MNTTIGTSQVLKTVTPTSGAKKLYYTRFVSDTLDVNQTISANTWNYAIAFREALLTVNWPVSGSGTSNITVYVWRPSNGTKVGNILDSSSGVNLSEPSATSTIKSNFNTFSGSSVTALAGDVICFELYLNPTLGQSSACDLYFDGTTETNNNNTTVSNHAAYIETPQTLTFGPSLTRVLTSDTLKYSIVGRIVHANTLKYNLWKQILHNQTLKYNVWKQILRANTLKYNLIGRILHANTLKYNLIGRILHNQTLKYNLWKQIKQADTLKYNLIGRILHANTLKYNVTGVSNANVSAIDIVKASNQYIDCTNNTAVKQGETANSEVSWSYWLRKTANPASNAAILIPGARSMIHYMDTTGNIVVNTYYHDTTSNQYYGASLSNNVWHHIVHCHSDINNRTTVYVDGTQTYNVTKNDYLASSGTLKMFFGSENNGSNGPSNSWNGQIDELRIYNVELTQTDVNTLKAGDHVTTGMTARFKFDENTGTTSTDTVGSLVATLGNGASWYTASLPIIQPEATRILHANTLKYSLIGRIVHANTLKYNLIGRILHSQTLKYNVWKQILHANTLKYNLIGRILHANTLKYNLIGRILHANTLKYNLIGRILHQNTLRYNLIGRILHANTLKYNLIGRIKHSNTILYNVRKQILHSQTLKYNLWKQVKHANTLLWSLLANLSRITNQNTLKYNIIQRQIHANTLKYSLWLQVKHANTLKYNLLKQILHANTLKYNLIGRILHSQTLKYNLWKQIKHANTLKYNLIGRVVHANILKYSLWLQVKHANILKYNLIGRIIHANILKYNLIGRIVHANILKYNLISRIKHANTLKYSILSLVKNIHLTITEADIKISDTFYKTRIITEDNINIGDLVNAEKTDNTPVNITKTINDTAITVGPGTVSRMVNKVRQIIENINIGADSATVSRRNKTRTITDNISIGDNLSLTKSQRNIQKSLSDNISLGDSVTRQTNKTRRIGGPG